MLCPCHQLLIRPRSKLEDHRRVDGLIVQVDDARVDKDRPLRFASAGGFVNVAEEVVARSKAPHRLQQIGTPRLHSPEGVVLLIPGWPMSV